MSRAKTDLILHPIRLRLLQVLAGKQMTTQQIAALLPFVPASSIYRHLRTLLDAGLVQVVETNMVKGIEEKVYQLAPGIRVDREDMQAYSIEDQKRLFSAYLSGLLNGFSDYLHSSEDINLLEDHAGFTDITFYASTEELDALGAGLNTLLAPYKENKPAEGRQRQLFTVITFPIERKKGKNE